MVEESLEFLNINDDDLLLPKTVRKAFRIPVTEQKHYKIILKDTSYEIANISVNGLGILLQTQADFSIGEILEDCELTLFDQSIKRLKGEVIHYSNDTSQQWHYGIRWIDISETSAKKISNVVSELKRQYFSDDISVETTE